MSNALLFAALVALTVASVGLGIWTVALNIRAAQINAEIVHLLKEHTA